MSKNQLHKEFNDVLSPQSIALNTTTIPVAGHVPPISSSRDLTIFEERLKTNLLYFRKRKRNYRIQTLLLLISILGIYYGYFVENANYPLFTRFLSLIAFLIHFVVINRSDYRRTMNQAKTYVPRVNRVLQQFHVAFCRHPYSPELSFSKKIPVELFRAFDATRKQLK